MLRWIFPAGRTDPVLHLAYWHVRLLSELLSPERAQRAPNILQAAKNMIGILAGNHELLSPITHHFGTLAALGLAELQRSGDAAARDDAAKLARDVLDYSIAPSPWNAAVREKLAAQLRPATAAAAGAAKNRNQNLQQLADLATAVDGSAAQPAAAAGEGAPKEEAQLLAAVGNNGVGVAVQPADAGERVDESGNENAGGGGGDSAAPDVRALLRNGYLTCFEEPEEEVVV
jgi:hypothetical protein